VLATSTTAAKEKMLSSFAPWCAETCIGASAGESQKPHQGFAAQNPILHRGVAWSKSTLALGLPEWAGKTASGPAVAANNGANANVAKSVTSQCLAGYNNSAAAKGIQFFSLYNLATNFWNALPDWTVLPAAKIALANTASWVSGQIGTTEFLSVTSTSATVIPSATTAVVDLAETAGKAGAAPAIIAGTGLDVLANAGCATVGRQSAGQMNPLPPGWASSF
jgi:hypothetical protein